MSSNCVLPPFSLQAQSPLPHALPQFQPLFGHKSQVAENARADDQALSQACTPVVSSVPGLVAARRDHGRRRKRKGRRYLASLGTGWFLRKSCRKLARRRSGEDRLGHERWRRRGCDIVRLLGLDRQTR